MKDITPVPPRFDSLSGLRALGFYGFRPVADLRSAALHTVPAAPGVYLVVRPRMSAPRFRKVGTGGYYKGKCPNVPIATLHREWIEGALVLYVGQTCTTLRKRIGAMIRFGKGASVPHWGGRLVWQLEDAAELQFCWKKVLERPPRDVEKELLATFKSCYGGRRPFANLRD